MFKEDKLFIEKEKTLRDYLQNLFSRLNVHMDLDYLINLIKQNLSVNFLWGFGMNPTTCTLLTSSINQNAIFVDYIKSCQEGSSQQPNVKKENSNKMIIDDYETLNHPSNSDYDINFVDENPPLKIDEDPLFKQYHYLYELLEKEKYTPKEISEILMTVHSNFDEIENLNCSQFLKSKIIETCIKNDSFTSTLRKNLEELLLVLLKQREIDDDEQVRNSLVDAVLLCNLEYLKTNDDISQDDQEFLIDNLSRSQEFKNYKRYVVNSHLFIPTPEREEELIKKKELYYESIICEILNENKVKDKDNYKEIAQSIIGNKTFSPINEKTYIPQKRKQKINEEIKNHPDLKNLFMDVEVNTNVETMTIDINNIIHLIKYSDDKQNEIIVNKFMIAKEELLKLHTILLLDPNVIRDDLSEGLVINFDELDKTKVRFSGAFGRKKNLLEFLENNYNFNNEKQILIEYLESKDNGVYLFPFISTNNSSYDFLLILWSKDENDFDDVNEMKSYINLLRYMTQLCNSNMVMIDNRDLEMIQPNEAKIQRLIEYETVSEEVKKEKFELREGIRLYLIKEPKEINLISSGSKACLCEKSVASQNNEIKKSSIDMPEIRFKEYLYKFSHKSKLTLADQDFDCNVIKSVLKKLLSEEIYTQLKQDIKIKEETLQKEINEEITEDFIKNDLMIKHYVVTMKMFNLYYPKEFSNFTEKINNYKLEHIKHLDRALASFKEGKYSAALDKLDSASHYMFSHEREAILKYLKDNKVPLTKDEEKVIENENKKHVLSFVTKIYNKQFNMVKGLFCSISEKDLLKYLNDEKKKIKKSFPNEEENIFYYILKHVRSHVKKFSLFDENQIRREKVSAQFEKQFDLESNKIILQYFQNFIDDLNSRNKKYNSVINILQISFDEYKGIYKIEHEKEIIREAKNIFTISELTPSEDEIRKFKKNPQYVITPNIYKRENKFFDLDVSDEVVSIIKGHGENIFVIINNSVNDHSAIKFFNMSVKSQSKLVISKPLGKKISLADYSEASKELLLYSLHKGTAQLALYRILEGFNMQSCWESDVTTRFNISSCKFIRNDNVKKSIWIVNELNEVIRIDIKNDSISKIKATFKNIEGMWIVPNSSCLVVLDDGKIIPIMTDTNNILSSFDLKGLNVDDATICMFDSQIHFIIRKGNLLISNVITASLGKSQLQIKMMKDTRFNESDKEMQNNILDYIFYIYDKFPIFSILKPIEGQVIEQNFSFYLSENVVDELAEKKITEKMKNIEYKIQKTQKPNPGLKLGENLKFFKAKSKIDMNSLFTVHCNLGEWIQNLICFIPIQIARAENNTFEVLTDGILLPIDDCFNVSDLTCKISLGLYESILNSWKGEIKVISSMGKQSTGKSYTLNHLSGSSFAISGARCTDGCWLTMKVTKDCLYVLLDFEGLGSFERTDQEDMLLSVFNAALSNATLFKTEYRIDREIDNMFKKFNAGGNLLKGSDKLFNGKFVIVIKDVPDRDIKQLKGEFEDKITFMMKKEKDKNFIDMLYRKGFIIFPFPSLESRDYYDEMEDLKCYINNKLKSVFNNGRDFLDTFKLILAKMSFGDFTSLNRQEVELRVKTINELMPNAILYGQTCNTINKNEDFVLRSMDDISIKIETRNEIFIKEFVKSISYDDKDISLHLKHFSKIIGIFNNNIKKTHSNHIDWHRCLRVFIEKVVEFRMKKVNEWLEMNISKWKDNAEFSDLITNVRNTFLHKSKEIKQSHKLCESKCSECYALCLKPHYHENNHLCDSTNHLCLELCKYCNDAGLSSECKFKFGHEEGHLCKDKPHTCSAPCEFSSKNDCEKECALMSGHAGKHLCGIADHKCKKKCSLEGCNSLCELKANSKHTVHKCIKEQCTKSCSISNCNMKCSSRDHFHSTKLSDKFKKENNIIEKDFIDEAGNQMELNVHICGNKHQCKTDCEVNGYCKVYVERKIIEEEYQGKKEIFKYQKQYVAHGEKLNCVNTIPPFKLKHEGPHIHSLEENTLHYCEEKCPTCENICEKPFGHKGKHTTAHGNMMNYHFISNQTDLDLGEHKYIVGESAKAEMCHIFCKNLGRGHIHTVNCDKKKGVCKYDAVKDKRRHQTCKYGPDEDVPKDEMWHEQYWNLINFEDPCAESEKEIFIKCPYKCASDKHEKEEPIYCELNIWHSKQDKSLTTNGYVSSDGHLYMCSHPEITSGYHFVLALDSSGSMLGQPWADLIFAVNSFVISRLSSNTDKLTIIVYNNNATLLFDFINFSQFDLNTLNQSFKNGCTSFSAAVSTSILSIRNHLASKLNPIFIFMSDGIDSSGREEMKSLYDEFDGQGLVTYVIGFGSEKIEYSLKDLSAKACGTYLQSVDGLQLKNSFLTISSVLGAKISVAKSTK